MSYDDFYNDGPSDWDLFMEEVKQNLMKTVKKEYLEEMDKLRKENQELQEVKQNWYEIKSSYLRKEEEFLQKERDMMRELSRKKLIELFKTADIKHTVYCIDSVRGKIPCCGKCDNGVIHFKSPSGKDMTEPCPVCGSRPHFYVTNEIDAIYIYTENNPYVSLESCYVKRESYGTSTTYINKDIFNDKAENFDCKDFLEHYKRPIFPTKELAQQVCDRLNKLKNIPDNIEVDE